MSRPTQRANRRWIAVATVLAAILLAGAVFWIVPGLQRGRQNAMQLRDGTLVKSVNQGMLSFFLDSRPKSVHEAIRLAIETDSIPGPLRAEPADTPFLINPNLKTWRGGLNASDITIWVEDPSSEWAHCAWGDGHVEFARVTDDLRPKWLDQAIDGGDFDELFEKK